MLGDRIPPPPRASRAAAAWRALHPTPTAAAEAIPEPSLAEAQRKREIALARLRQRELRTRLGQVVPRAEAEAVWTQIREHARDRLLRLPAEMAPNVARCGTLADIRGAVRDATYEALTDLASTQCVGDPAREPTPEPPVSDEATKLQAETAKVSAIGRLHQLDVDIADGVFVAIRSFMAAGGSAFANARQRLLALETLTPRLLGLDRAAAEDVIRAAVDDALRELPPRVRLDGDAPGALQVHGG